MQSYAAKQPDEQAKDTIPDEQAAIEEKKELTQQPYTTMKTPGEEAQAIADKKELTRLRRFVKDYFAEFFLASMFIIGMILAVIYLLAHTWR